MCTTTKSSRLRIIRLIAGSLFALLLTVGCAQPAGTLFPPLKEPLRWPAPPEPPRIQYVGQLTGSADLKPAVPFFKKMGTTVFGEETTQSLLTPYAVCTDNKDRLFIADSNAQLVHVMNLNTRQYAQWKPDDGKHMTQPVGIAFDHPRNRLLVADSIGGVIHIFDGTTGKYTGEIGQNILQRPCGLAVDGAGMIFVADVTAHQVVMLAPNGHLITRIGHRGEQLGEFNYPTNVAIDHKGRLYVSDSLNFRVQQFGTDLKPIRQIGKKGDLPGYFAQPKGIAIDRDDHLYVIDSQFEAIQIFNDQGELLLNFGEEGQGPGQFWLPALISIDDRNRIWVADSYNRRVEVFEYLPEGKS
jgi:DNA-binding beta-propeller fold protein YncE